MPKKLNKAGEQQEYIPSGQGDASGEYANDGGSNKHFAAFKKPTDAIDETKKSFKSFSKDGSTKVEEQEDDILKKVNFNGHTYYDQDIQDNLTEIDRLAANPTMVYKKGQVVTDNRTAEEKQRGAQAIENEIKKQQDKSLLDKKGRPIGRDIKKEKKAFIVMGLPASGKSKIATDRLKQMHGAFEVDPDIMKAYSEKMQKNGNAVSQVHDESTYLSDEMFKKVIADGSNVILPKVGGTRNPIERKIKELKAAGYTVDLIDVDLPYQESLKRNLRRYYELKEKNDPSDPPRIVNPALITATQDKHREVFDSLVADGLVDNYAMYSNDVPFGSPAKFIKGSKKYFDE